jgi:uncharacterized protein YlxW (UPF0749 family)
MEREVAVLQTQVNQLQTEIKEIKEAVTKTNELLTALTLRFWYMAGLSAAGGVAGGGIVGQILNNAPM